MRCGVMLAWTCGVALALSTAATAQSTRPTDLTARSPAEARPIVRDDLPGTSATAAQRQTTGVPFDAAKVAMSLGVVLVLILVLKWSARRMFPGQIGVRASRAAVEVLSRTPLSPRQQFLLLRVGKRLVVVADGAGGMNAICQVSDPDEVAEMLGQLQGQPHGGSESIGKSFLAMFGNNREKFETVEPPPAAVPQMSSGDPEVGMTREEIGGLMEKIRLLSRQFKR